LHEFQVMYPLVHIMTCASNTVWFFQV